MPKPLERFLHTYNIKLAKNLHNTGKWIAGGSATAFVASLASGGQAVFTVGGIGITAAASVSLIGLTGGTVLLALPLSYGIARATFLRKDRQSAFEKNKQLTDEDFDYHMDWDCYWTTVAVVGYERTGKTLLKNRLRGFGSRLGDPNPSTSDLEIHLTRLEPRKKVYMALLDDRGAVQNQSANQADLIGRVVDKARIVILVLDHADTYRYGNQAELDRDRLKKQEEFIKETLIQYVKDRQLTVGVNAIPLRTIMVVMNKADSWESTGDKREIHDWTQERARILKEELSCDTPIYYLSVQDSNHPGYSTFFHNLISYCREAS